jgi:hypothetical protein
MKKLFVVLIAVVFASCSQDQVESTNPVAETSLSVLDGKLLSFKDDKSFIDQYSKLAGLKTTKEVQGWVSKKGLKSLLNSSNDSIEMQNDSLDNKRIIYSDAIKAILNSDSKFKIGSKVLWLNERNFYILPKSDLDKKSEELITLKNDFDVYGKLLNFSDSKKNTSSSLTSRNVVPNENRSKTYVVGLPNDKRYVLDLFNETIVINDFINSSKMYLRCTLQYKSCSFWRCTWKNDTTTRWNMYGYNLIDSGNVGNPLGYWNFTPPHAEYMVGSQTLLLATWGTKGPIDPKFYQYPNFYVSGSVIWRYYSSAVEYPQAIAWY